MLFPAVSAGVPFSSSEKLPPSVRPSVLNPTRRATLSSTSYECTRLPPQYVAVTIPVDCRFSLTSGERHKDNVQARHRDTSNRPFFRTIVARLSTSRFIKRPLRDDVSMAPGVSCCHRSYVRAGRHFARCRHSADSNGTTLCSL